LDPVLDYHQRELSIARDPAHRNHLMPPIRARHRKILDIGCGMGQTLIAAGLPPGTTAWGIDPDAAAIQEGRRIAPPNIHLSVGVGERLGFSDASFDFVICRVALPYMRIRPSLSEIRRVLTPGGECWLVLHSARMYRRRLVQSLHSRHWKDVLYCGFVAINSSLFRCTGKQLAVRGRTETFQTPRGIHRALAHAGLKPAHIKHETFFIVTAEKPELSDQRSAQKSAVPSPMAEPARSVANPDMQA
jgi:SAM-dependent methyltransferase